jgi:MFS family permease
VNPVPESDALADRSAFPRVIATLVCVHASMAATRVTATLLVLHQGYPEWVVGVLMSLFAVAPIGLSLWAGRLADAHGLHKPLGIGVTLGGLGAGLAVVSQHPLALALAALATGGATAVAAVGIQREAGMLARNGKDLKRVFSWVALGPAVSNTVAPVVVGLLIDHVGYRAGFAFAALLPLLAWQIARRLPHLKPVQVRAAASAPSLSALSLLKLPAFASLLLVNIALSSCWDAHSFAVPVLGHARNMSASAIGLVLGSFAVAATLVRLAISRFADHLQEAVALRWAMGLATSVCAVYYWLPGPTGMLLGSAVLGLALGSVQPMILALLHQVTPTARHGQALGLRMMATNAITIVMPLSFGGLATLSGVGAAPMWLMGSMVLLAQWPARRIPRSAPD